MQFINKEYIAQQEFGQNAGAIYLATKALKRKLVVLIKAIWSDEGKNIAEKKARYIVFLSLYSIYLQVIIAFKRK